MQEISCDTSGRIARDDPRPASRGSGTSENERGYKLAGFTGLATKFLQHKIEPKKEIIKYQSVSYRVPTSVMCDRLVLLGIYSVKLVEFLITPNFPQDHCSMHIREENGLLW